VNDRLAAYEGLSIGLAEGIKLEKELHRSSLKDSEMMDGLKRFADGRRPEPPVPPD